MANVKEVGLCPRCGGELAKADQTKCEVCNYQFPYQSEVFGTPDYVSSQHEVLVSRLSKMPSKDLNDWSLNRAVMKFFVNMADDDRLFAMRDAEAILRHIFISNSTGVRTGEIIKLGKRIGELATVIDEHIRLGGRPNGFSDTPQPTTGRQDPFDIGGEDSSSAIR